MIGRIRRARHAGCGAAVALALLVGAVQAESLRLDSGTDQVTLLELYTSQGCSSCPPAERWLNGYVGDADLWKRVVPVVFHVDYWDDLGWSDPYAEAAHGERQRDYARAGRTRTVYTPGFFANGREWRGWTFGLGPRGSDLRPGRLLAAVDGARLSASFPAAGEPLELHVALLGFGIETPVARGENRGRTLAQEFVVLQHATHTSDSGEWRIALPHTAPGQARRRAIALWVSRQGDPVPLQATGGWLP